MVTRDPALCYINPMIERGKKGVKKTGDCLALRASAKQPQPEADPPLAEADRRNDIVIDIYQQPPIE